MSETEPIGGEDLPTSESEVTPEVVEAHLESLTETMRTFKDQMGSLVGIYWNSLANPKNVDYRGKRPVEELGGTPISQMLLDAFKTLDTDNPYINMFGADRFLKLTLNTLKNELENAGKVNNIDQLNPGEIVEIYLEETTGRWKLRILNRKPGEEIDGYIFPTYDPLSEEALTFDDLEEEMSEEPPAEEESELIALEALNLIDNNEEATLRQEMATKRIPYYNGREAIEAARRGEDGLIETDDGGLDLEEGYEWVGTPPDPPNYATMDVRDHPEDVTARATAEAEGLSYVNAGEAYLKAIHRQGGYFLTPEGDIWIRKGLTWAGEEPNWAWVIEPSIPEESTPTPSSAPASTSVDDEVVVLPPPVIADNQDAEETDVDSDDAESEEDPPPAPVEDSESMSDDDRRKHFDKSIRKYGAKKIDLDQGLAFEYIPAGERAPVECVLTSDGLVIEGERKEISHEHNMTLCAEFGDDSKSILNIGDVEISSLKGNRKKGFEIQEVTLRNVTFGEAVTSGFTVGVGPLSTELKAEKGDVLTNLREKGIVCDEVDYNSDGSVKGSIPDILTLRVTDVSAVGIKNPYISLDTIYNLVEGSTSSLFAASVPKTMTGEKMGVESYVQGDYSATVA
jgi:hypothetical protein